LRKQITFYGLDVSERGIEPGEDWQAELVKQMSAAEAVIACARRLSHVALLPRRDRAGQRENKPIYPVIVRPLGAGESLAAVQLITCSSSIWHKIMTTV